MNFTEAKSVIEETLGNTLSDDRYLHSQNIPSGSPRKPGAVFVTWSKDMLRAAKGVVMTSTEAVTDATGASHWTPNVFRFGTYSNRGPRFGTFEGHSEENLKAINAFVVDIDYPEDQKPDYIEIYDCFDVEISRNVTLSPTYVLNTPHGFQAYYLLAQPVWIRRTEKGTFPALASAKLVSEAIRRAVAMKNPHTDTGANHFGFFRLPSTQNLIEVDDDQRPTFSVLQKWSMSQKKDREISTKGVVRSADQVHTEWFHALACARVSNAQGSGYGRNNTLLTLCLAQYSSGVSKVEAYDFADQWSSAQSDPLKDNEVRTIVRSAYSGRYQGANMGYVRELCARYAPQTKIMSGLHAWNHVKKPRAQRSYSHQEEWRRDLLSLMNRSTDLVKGHARFTYQALQDSLGISRQSLLRLLNEMQSQATISVRRVLGRNGGLYLATARMIAKYVGSQHTLNSPRVVERTSVPHTALKITMQMTLPPMQDRPDPGGTG